VGVGTITASHDVGYLTKEVARGHEGYYAAAVAAGEPPGRWHGRGAAALGLTGEVDTAVVTALYTYLADPRDETGEGRLGVRPVYVSAEERYAAAAAREPDASPERLAELRAKAEDAARSTVAFYDWTFSAAKSISVFQAALEHEAQAAAERGDVVTAARAAADVRYIDEALLDASGDGLDYAERVAGFGRVGHHGGGSGRFIDTGGLTVAQYPQHDSRDRDPQLHAHNAILNNVECADGRRRALDGAGLYREAATMAAIASRSLEARLADRWPGLTFVERADGNGREIAPALVPPELTHAFSRRRQAVEGRTDALAEQFRATRGREPTRSELAKLAQRATLQTRAGKSHDGMTKAEQVAGWAATATAVAPGGFPAVLEKIRTADPATAGGWHEEDVIARALSRVSGESTADQTGGRGGGQTWTRAQLVRAVAEELSSNLGLPAGEVTRLVEGLADKALTSGGAVRITADPVGVELLPAAARLADGRSALARPGADKYATAGQLVAERALRAAAVQRGAVTVDAGQAKAFVDLYAAAGRPLGADQAAAVTGVLTSGARLEALSAAAGTGKTFTIGAIADAWQSATGPGGEPAGRRVFGLAPSQIATEGLAEEGLSATRNLAAWETGQRRAEQGRPVDGDAGFVLAPGDLVIVDEAGMADTGTLLRVQQRCAAAGAKLLLVGDERQLAAIGAGGTFADVAEHGVTYRLVDVRRFGQQWEAAASLRLRAGDASVVAEYSRHGRVRDGGTVEQARDAAAREHLAAVLAGRDALLVVPTNEQAAAASAAIHDRLVRLGLVGPGGVPLQAGTVAGVGDLVQYRRNDRRLCGVDGNTSWPANRATGRVVALRDDGGLVTAPVTGRARDGAEILGAPLQLPARYVARHVALGYASTVHAAQGRTVDLCLTVAGTGTNAETLYVAMTRGRDGNVVFVVTRATGPGAEPGEAHTVEARPAESVLRDVIRSGQDDPNLAALQQQERSEAAERSPTVLIDALRQGIDLATAGRTGEVLDQLTADGLLTVAQRQAIAADEAYPSLDHLARAAEAAGHDRGDVLAAALARGSLDGSRSAAKVLHARVRTVLHGQMTPQLDSFHDLIPPGHDPAYTDYLEAIADRLDEVRYDLGAQVADRADPWAVRDLGPVPDDPAARLDWEDRAGWAEVARQLGGVDSDADPLGAAPPAGAVEHHAVFRTAHHVLNRPEAGADEAEASDGLLRARARAADRVRDWLPAYVDDQLAATSEAADTRAADATMWEAHAEIEDDPATAATLRAQAAEARADVDRLADLRDQLEEIAAARAEALLHTAVTRDKAERATIELAIRGIDRDDPVGLVTAEQWLAARDNAERAEDPHRQVTDELDLTDAAADRATAHDEAMRGTVADDQSPAAAAVDTATAEAAADHEPAPEDVAGVAARDGGHTVDAGPASGRSRPEREDDPDTDADADERAAPGADRANDPAAGQATHRAEKAPADHDAAAERRRVPPPDRTQDQVDHARDALRDVAAQRAQEDALETADTAEAEAARSADPATDTHVEADAAMDLTLDR
jgi:conjugative relaxase-like TrwC/TraI family protein